MSAYTEAADKIQAHVLEDIQQVQAANVEMVANFSKTAGALVPANPDIPVGYNPKQLIEKSFDFTTNLLELQKGYLVRLTEALTPLAKTATATEKAAKAA